MTAAHSLAVLACGGDAMPESGPPPAPSVEHVVVDTATMVVPLVLPGQLDVEHDAHVFARSLGIVESVRADVGDRVREGDVLATLEHTDQTIAVEDAEAAWDAARRRAERVRELAGTGAIAKADSEVAEVDARRTALRLRQARRDLELTRIVAPFDGAVARRRVRVGQLVEPLDTLFRVTALGPLRVSVQLPERAPEVARGDTVAVLAAGRDPVPGVVDRVAPTFDPASGTREVVVRVPRPEGLRPGATVDVALGGAPRPVLAIADTLLVEGRYVLVWEDGRSTLRAVTPGSRLPDGRLEILAGLVPGERVVPRP